MSQAYGRPDEFAKYQYAEVFHHPFHLTIPQFLVQAFISATFSGTVFD